MDNREELGQAVQLALAHEWMLTSVISVSLITGKPITASFLTLFSRTALHGNIGSLAY